MFFYIENLPIFKGLYQIMKTSHKITPNNMTTTVEGIKMRCILDTGFSAVVPPTSGQGVLLSLMNSGPSNDVVNIANFGTSKVKYIYNQTYNGKLFTDPYEKVKDQNGDAYSMETIVINNPFYYSSKASGLQIANVPLDWTKENPNNSQANKNIIALQEKVLKFIWKEFNNSNPLLIGSGYRSDALNKKIKGASTTSNHLSGLAADVSIPGDQNPETYIKLYNWLIKNRKGVVGGLQLPLLEVIIEKDKKDGSVVIWVHVAVDNQTKEVGKIFKTGYKDVVKPNDTITEISRNFTGNIPPCKLYPDLKC
jgi:hypothetical protein